MIHKVKIGPHYGIIIPQQIMEEIPELKAGASLKVSKIGKDFFHLKVVKKTKTLVTDR